MVCFLSITALPAATILNVVSPISFYLNSLSLPSFYLRNLFYLIPLGVVHEVIASGRCLICLVHRNPVHAPAGIHQRPHVEPVAPIEPQEHPVIVIILRGDGSCNRIEGLFRPGSVDIVLVAGRNRSLAESGQLPPVAPGNACERRRWRMQRAGVGAAVGDWLGGLPPQTEPGTARGSSHPGIAADSRWYRRCRFHQYFVYANL